MTERLVRAVQTGGAVCQLEDGRYGVWRGHDRRGRMIGCLDSDQVQGWQLRDKLRRLGDGVPKVWVWQGAGESAMPCTSGSKQALQILDHSGNDVAYLARLLLFQPARAREGFIQRIQAFRADYAHMHTTAGLMSMDWRGLSYGVRIDRTPQSWAGDDEGLTRAARRRLRALRDALGDTDWQTWLRISVHLWTLRDFERRAHMTAATLSQRLPQLSGVFDGVYASAAAERYKPAADC